MKHTAVYVRVSSTSQSGDSQELDLRRWVEGQPKDIPVVWYHDQFTGTVMARPGMTKLHDAVARGDVATVVCWRLDRLGRTASGLTALFDDLQKAGVNLVSLKDGLDLSTAAGRLMANVLASVSAFETEVRKERQIAGIASAKARGKSWGGSEKGRLLSVTPEQIREVHRLKQESRPIAEIARILRLSRPTVYKIAAQA